MAYDDSFGAYVKTTSDWEVYSVKNNDNEIQYDREKGYAIEHCRENLVKIFKKVEKKSDEDSKGEKGKKKKFDRIPVPRKDTIDLLVVRRTYKYHKFSKLTLKVTSFLQCPMELQYLQKVSFFEYIGNHSGVGKMLF